jgi:outer membrane immunogenic protein
VKPKWLASFLLASCVSLFAAAQSKEVTVNYSLIVYNPAKSLTGDRDLNGGGGSFGFNYNEYLTMKGEFQGYATTTLTYHVPQTENSAAGTITTQANMFTYLFGPQFNWVLARKRIFGEALFGGAYTNAYANLFKAANVTGLSANNNGFAMAFGGGLDFGVAKHVAIRPVQFDYFLTRYDWKSLGINNQSNFRYQAGVVFAFGNY